mgnify:FL=1
MITSRMNSGRRPQTDDILTPYALRPRYTRSRRAGAARPDHRIIDHVLVSPDIDNLVHDIRRWMFGHGGALLRAFVGVGKERRVEVSAILY